MEASQNLAAATSLRIPRAVHKVNSLNLCGLQQADTMHVLQDELVTRRKLIGDCSELAAAGMRTHWSTP